MFDVVSALADGMLARSTSALSPQLESTRPIRGAQGQPRSMTRTRASLGTTPDGCACVAWLVMTLDTQSTATIIAKEGFISSPVWVVDVGARVRPRAPSCGSVEDSDLQGQAARGKGRRAGAAPRFGLHLRRQHIILIGHGSMDGKT